METETETNRKYLLASTQEMLEYASKYSTPFHLYDEKTIRTICKELKVAFSWAPGFTNHFAVKATPNPYILEIIKEEGFGTDCSSMTELVLSELVGFSGEEIYFTSNNTPLLEYQKAKELGAILNLDDISHIDFIHETIGLPNFLCFRYNPGALRAGNKIIGDPKNAKFGLTKNQIFEAYEKSKALGVQRFALHTMVISNSLNQDDFVQTAKMMFELIVEIKDRTGIRIEAVNLGGGIGIAYRAEEKSVDLMALSETLQKLYTEIIIASGLNPLKIVLECGRYITGPAGCIITRIIHEKATHKIFLGVDACMADLMRPALYNAYHHITVLNDSNLKLNGEPRCSSRRKLKSNDESAQKCGIYDVVGSLCENNDKFACDRYLGTNICIGYLLIIHDTGAHGHSMGFNYNGKLRSGEFLRDLQGKIQKIRRAETIDDLFITLDWKVKASGK